MSLPIVSTRQNERERLFERAAEYSRFFVIFVLEQFFRLCFQNGYKRGVKATYICDTTQKGLILELTAAIPGDNEATYEFDLTGKLDQGRLTITASKNSIFAAKLLQLIAMPSMKSRKMEFGRSALHATVENIFGMNNQCRKITVPNRVSWKSLFSLKGAMAKQRATPLRIPTDIGDRKSYQHHLNKIIFTYLQSDL